MKIGPISIHSEQKQEKEQTKPILTSLYQLTYCTQPLIKLRLIKKNKGMKILGKQLPSKIHMHHTPQINYPKTKVLRFQNYFPRKLTLGKKFLFCMPKLHLMCNAIHTNTETQ